MSLYKYNVQEQVTCVWVLLCIVDLSVCSVDDNPSTLTSHNRLLLVLVRVMDSSKNQLFMWALL
jgi:hypothetical protein